LAKVVATAIRRQIDGDGLDGDPQEPVAR
jgi:hypothetical protein